MSDQHDHPHDHDHEHDHDHGHDHGHEHHHEHAHPAPAAPEMAPQEDSSSRALAEALGSSFGIVKWVMGILFLLFLGSGVFRVQQGQRAVLLRFGKPVGLGNQALIGPGIHWGWPYPIDEVVKIHYAQLQTVKSDVGWYNTTPEKEALDQEDYAGPSLNPAVDGYAITGDGNIIHTRAVLTYQIEDPVRYEFEFTSASNAVRDALDNALLFAAARFRVDDVLTRDITRFQDVVTARVTDLVQRENLGVVIQSCQVESRPPRYLKPAFDSVLTALAERDKAIHEAESYQNQTLYRAAATAAGVTNTAEADRVQLVESVKAEAQRFTDLLPRYNANPAVFANILLLDKIGRVLTNVEDKIYLPERADGKTRELRLQLSREPLKPVGTP
ncbi:MAG TPA: protease modulator HflK [Verrucomicrobiae bacterium]|jgi:membrane protease subunit HflK|nr:protease modulator HflK [Verrucomicrobiae bacterium]